MIRRVLRSLRAAHAYVRVCVYQLRELTRGGAIGDSDRPWPPLDETRAPLRIDTHERTATPRPVLAPLGTCPRCGSIRVWRYGADRIDPTRTSVLRCARCSHVFESRRSSR